ncbi:hybrid sensor histidine kinase/response regulator [Massilia yuzhufengensis]|uniref:histidine kinase n=1 Tax=Massilia yuzhufengensis TaxID=1164594 RepID=A0A1I1IDW2_9BURK|nr:ATP-binding protein [Massilia yuzhufengensis]SFC31410.1 Signal transduction histidine kinase [Massilia yuzhufengensis]
MLRQRSTVSLRRLLVLLTAVGLLPLALMGVWGLHLVSEFQQREQQRSLLDLARALSSAVDAELDGAASILTSMARTPAMEVGDLRGFYDLARAQVAAKPEWLSVILADDRGGIVFRTAAPFGSAGGPIADPASLQRAVATGAPVAGGIAVGPRGRPAYPVRVPVTDKAGRRYILTAVIQPGRMLRVIERQKVPSNSVIAILDGAGSIVARSIGQDTGVGAKPHASLVRLMRDGGAEAVGVTTSPTGDPLAAAYTRSRYGWAVAVGIPTSAMARASLPGIMLYASGLAASLLACSLVATLLSGRIVRSFRSLQQGTAALGAGLPVLVAPSRITEIDQMESALKAAAAQRDAHEAERSSLLASLENALEDSRDAGRVKDEFLAMLGHELRNPLSPIVASLDLMDMRGDAANVRERTILRRQANHLKRLVDDLLDVSRITSGKLQIELRPVNLADVVRHVVASFPGAPIALEAPGEAWVQGDESRLTQVLNNLLSNAARFGNGLTRVSLAVDGGMARLAVSDNGVGMDKDMLERVFAPFFQAPQPLARHTGGLGLGLAIVRRIVELHGGTVAASSEGAGKGSCFEVALPLGAVAAPAHDAVAAADAARLDVLLVDDNLDAAATTAAVLEHLGHVVRVAGTGGEAIEQARRQAPDVAILDIGLPDMDGYALAARLQVCVPGTRLVALTGYGQEADVALAAGAGFDLHLTKPATLEDLQRALAAV